VGPSSALALWPIQSIFLWVKAHLTDPTLALPINNSTTSVLPGHSSAPAGSSHHLHLYLEARAALPAFHRASTESSSCRSCTSRSRLYGVFLCKAANAARKYLLSSSRPTKKRPRQSIVQFQIILARCNRQHLRINAAVQMRYSDCVSKPLHARSIAPLTHWYFILVYDDSDAGTQTGWPLAPPDTCLLSESATMRNSSSSINGHLLHSSLPWREALRWAHP